MWTFVTLVHIQFNSGRVDAVSLVNRLRVVQAGNRGSIPGLGNVFRLTCRLESRGIMVWFVPETRDFSLLRVAIPPLPFTQPSFDCLLGTHCSEVEWSEPQADRSSPAAAHVKNDCSCTSIPPRVLMACTEATSPSIKIFCDPMTLCRSTMQCRRINECKLFRLW